MKTGTVKFFHVSHGYGFIAEDFTKRDFFFHFSNQLDTDDVLNSGTRVSFSEGQNRKGVCATNVSRL